MEVMTITGNLLAEWTFDILRLHPGTTHRAETMQFQVGGKGVNVARALARLGVDVEALGFASGPMRELCSDWLRNKHVVHRWFPLEIGVRPGVVIRQSGEPDTAETTFLGLDLAVPASSWQDALHAVADAAPQWLAICGSIPGWDAAFYEATQSLLQTGKTKVCVDTYGPPLEDLVHLPVELVKINRNELERLLPEMAGAGSLDLLAAASETSPVRNWIITDGPRPVLAAYADGNIFEVHPAEVEEVSPTGSGDTFLAALLQQSLSGSGPEDMLSYAGACATANAASPGVADFSLPVAEAYRPKIVRL